MEVTFKVARCETAVRRCERCGGVGYRLNKTVNGTFKNPCMHCQDGRITIERRTEVTLQEALRALGLIK